MKASEFKKLIREEVRRVLKEAQSALNPNDTYQLDLLYSRDDFDIDKPMRKVSGNPVQAAQKVMGELRAMDKAMYREFVSGYPLDADTVWIHTGEESVTIIGKPKSPKYGPFWEALNNNDLDTAAEMFKKMEYEYDIDNRISMASKKNEATTTIDPTLLAKLKTAVAARKRDPEDENAHDELENILMQIYQKMGAEDAEGLAASNMEDEVTMTGPVSAVVSLIKDTAEEEGL